MSSSASASAGITLRRKPPVMMFGEMLVRSIELVPMSDSRSSVWIISLSRGFSRLRYR